MKPFNLLTLFPAALAWQQEPDSALARIVNGEPAQVNEFSFFVDFEGCGGTLIHEDIVMTAAHCDDFDEVDIVYVGSFTEGTIAEGAEERRIVGRLRHPGFNDYSLENDVMLLKIDEPSAFSPVEINRDAHVPAAGEDLIVVGQGSTDADGWVYPGNLHKGTVQHSSLEDCEAVHYAACGYDVIFDDIMVCAGSKTGTDICYGDSGGPLLKQVGNSSYVQVGITSWSLECGSSVYPAVYTRVSGVKDWIDENVCEMSENPPVECFDIVHNEEASPIIFESLFPWLVP